MPLSKIQQIDNQVVPNLGRRNLLINGAMRVHQRGNQTSSNGASTYFVDRFNLYHNSSAAVANLQQSTDVPSGQGFSKSLLIDVTTADTSIAAGEVAVLRQIIEGQNLQHLVYGTSSAKTLTLSFWVKSAKTGTHLIELYHLSSPTNRTISKTYTINSANTWEHKEIQIEGDTATTIDDDANYSIAVQWPMFAGSTYASGSLQTTWGNLTNANRMVGQQNLFDSASNNFYLTGVQLEVGSAATEFEHRSVGEELELCKRYFFKAKFAHSAYGTTSIYPEKQYYYPTEMRANPTISITGGTAANIASQSVRYNVTGGFAHNMGPSSNGMMYIGGGGNACDITFTAEL